MALIGDKAAHDPILASWANTIRNQTIQVTTSGARPGSPTEGMAIYETDTDRMLIYDGSAWVEVSDIGAWTTHTPVLKQGSTTITTSGGGGTTYAAYRKHGRKVTYAGMCECNSTGTSSNPLSLALPVSIANHNVFHVVGGNADWFNGSVHRMLIPAVDNADLTIIRFVTPDAAGVSGFTGSAGANTTNAISASDEFNWWIEYESAS